MEPVVSLHAQIFPASKIYTPDNLRADNKANATANLRNIVLPSSTLGGSWPSISALRGKARAQAPMRCFLCMRARVQGIEPPALQAPTRCSLHAC
jgi:hypothetical protein